MSATASARRAAEHVVSEVCSAQRHLRIDQRHVAFRFLAIGTVVAPPCEVRRGAVPPPDGLGPRHSPVCDGRGV